MAGAAHFLLTRLLALCSSLSLHFLLGKTVMVMPTLKICNNENQNMYVYTEDAHYWRKNCICVYVRILIGIYFLYIFYAHASRGKSFFFSGTIE